MDLLNAFQVDVIAAVLTLGGHPTAAAIAEVAVSRSAKPSGLAAAYLALNKLEGWGLLARPDGASPDIARPDRDYRVTDEGRQALRYSLTALLTGNSAQRDGQLRKWREYAAFVSEGR